MNTHTAATAAVVRLENPVLAAPDVLVGLIGTLTSMRLLLEVDFRVREAGNAAHRDECWICCCLWVLIFDDVPMASTLFVVKRGH